MKKLLRAAIIIQASTDLGTGSNNVPMKSNTHNINVDDKTLTSCVLPPVFFFNCRDITIKFE